MYLEWYGSSKDRRTSLRSSIGSRCDESGWLLRLSSPLRSCESRESRSRRRSREELRAPLLGLSDLFESNLLAGLRDLRLGLLDLRDKPRLGLRDLLRGLDRRGLLDLLRGLNLRRSGDRMRSRESRLDLGLKLRGLRALGLCLLGLKGRGLSGRGLNGF